jgi:flagellar basal-body rod protein FlgG
VEFGEPGQLRKTGNNLFEDPGLAQAQPVQASQVRQSYLETSNVDPTRAMSDLMVAQRTYEASARMVQLQDDMTSRAVNDVGRV